MDRGTSRTAVAGWRSGGELAIDRRLAESMGDFVESREATKTGRGCANVSLACGDTIVALGYTAARSREGCDCDLADVEFGCLTNLNRSCCSRLPRWCLQRRSASSWSMSMWRSTLLHSNLSEMDLWLAATCPALRNGYWRMLLWASKASYLLRTSRWRGWRPLGCWCSCSPRSRGSGLTRCFWPLFDL